MEAMLATLKSVKTNQKARRLKRIIFGDSFTHQINLSKKQSSKRSKSNFFQGGLFKND
jgi:hypothetical protein